MSAPHDDTNPAFEGLPSYGGYLTSHGGEGDVATLYRCGGCEVPSSDVRSYSLPTVALLPVVFLWRVDEMMKCPRCMRKHIIFRLPLTILLSHILSPILVTWWLVVFVKTFFRRPH